MLEGIASLNGDLVAGTSQACLQHICELGVTHGGSIEFSHSQSQSHVHFAVCDSPKGRVVIALSRLFSCSCSSGMQCLANTDRIAVVALSCFLKFIYMYMYGPCWISLLCEPFGLLKNELTFYTRLCVTLMLCYSGYPL